MLDPTRKHAVSDTIDPFWHAHILHTREYMVFCDAVYGQYIPHEPLDPEDAVAVNAVAGLYEYTVGVYQQLFSYMSPVFYPLSQPRDRLMCAHTDVRNELVRSNGLVLV